MTGRRVAWKGGDRQRDLSGLDIAPAPPSVPVRAFRRPRARDPRAIADEGAPESHLEAASALADGVRLGQA
jgi:hypothetical protein